MSFNALFFKHKSKNEATSNIKIHQLFSSIGLDKVGIYLKDSPFESDIGNVNLHPTNRTQRLVNINETFFDRNGSGPTSKQNIYIFFKK